MAEEKKVYHISAPQDETAETEVDRSIRDRHGNIIDETYLSEADLDSKQDKLVSGVNIRTVNEVSLLGRGNISLTADVRINGISMLNSMNIAEISLGPGFALADNTVRLSTFGLNKTVPRDMSLLDQDDVRLLAERNGETTYVRASDLDYTRMRVVQTEDETNTRNGDFIFKKITT